MKKIVFLFILSMFVCTTVSAYNPPVNGESFMEYATPKLLSGSLSTAGGGIFTASPEAIVLNPALTATEQRTDLNLAYTALFSTSSISKEMNSVYGNIIQSSILMPSKWFVFTGLVNFTSAKFSEMYLGNSLNIKANLAKPITDKLDVGLGVNVGFLFGVFDWALSANVGALYRIGDLGFLKDFRIGASVSNLGKVFTNTNSIRPVKFGTETSPFPTFAYFRVGASALFVSTETIKLGLSVDFETPLFQNLLISTGLNFSVKDCFFVSVQEKINFKELANDYVHFIPSIGLSYKFKFNINNVEYFDNKDWNKNEMRISTAYKTVYETINAISADVDITLGLKDETAPEIMLWDEE